MTPLQGSITYIQGKAALNQGSITSALVHHSSPRQLSPYNSEQQASRSLIFFIFFGSLCFWYVFILFDVFWIPFFKADNKQAGQEGSTTPRVFPIFVSICCTLKRENNIVILIWF